MTILFLLIICSIIVQCSLVQFDFSYNETAPYNISLCIGRKDNCYPFLVSPMVTTTMVLSRRRFNPETSPTFTRISEDMNMGIYKGRSWSGYEVKDNIYVKDTDIEIKDFKFILIKGGVHFDKYYGIVGLGNSYYKNGNDSDFLMMIKEKGYIKEQLITFGKSMLKLGEREEMKNDIKKKECRTRDKRYNNPQSFFCIVEAILVYANDKIYSDDISEQIRFSFEEFEIHCPHHFFKIQIESIFTPFINSNKCREEKAKANFLDTVIYCD